MRTLPLPAAAVKLPMNRQQVAAAALLAAILLPLRVAAAVEEALQRYVDDYRSDPMLVDAYFGVKIGENWWTVESAHGRDGTPPRVELTAGPPAKPTWYFKIESADALERLDRGDVTFGTLAGKANSSDYAPMDIDVMPGHLADGKAPGSEFYETLTKIGFHFWYRGNPEVVPFARQAMRRIHGTDATALYYQPGLRTIAFSMKPGQHAFEGENSKGPWSKLLVFTSGRGKALIDGRTIDVQSGERLFVPPKVVNEIWNDSEEPLEGIVIVFGEGA